MPELDAAAQAHPEARFLALSIDADPPVVREAALRLGLRVPVATADGELLGPLGLRSVPSLLFVSRDGVVTARAEGVHDRAFIDRELTRAASGLSR